MSYRMNINKNDPELCIKMPPRMLKDLISRCEENGRDPNIEILIRLSRSLENDFQRDDSDELLSAIFSDDAVDDKNINKTQNIIYQDINKTA